MSPNDAGDAVGVIQRCRPTLTNTNDAGNDAPMECHQTGADIEGPFYRPNVPIRNELDLYGDAGTRLALSGRVLDLSCNPIPNAVVDIWHADPPPPWPFKICKSPTPWITTTPPARCVIAGRPRPMLKAVTVFTPKTRLVPKRRHVSPHAHPRKSVGGRCAQTHHPALFCWGSVHGERPVGQPQPCRDAHARRSGRRKRTFNFVSGPLISSPPPSREVLLKPLFLREIASVSEQKSLTLCIERPI